MAKQTQIKGISEELLLVRTFPGLRSEGEDPITVAATDAIRIDSSEYVPADTDPKRPSPGPTVPIKPASPVIPAENFVAPASTSVYPPLPPAPAPVAAVVPAASPRPAVGSDRLVQFLLTTRRLNDDDGISSEERPTTSLNLAQRTRAELQVPRLEIIGLGDMFNPRSAASVAPPPPASPSMAAAAVDPTLPLPTDTSDESGNVEIGQLFASGTLG